MIRPRRLWLVRHARVPDGQGRCYGHSDWLADTAETVLAAERLAGLMPEGLSVRVSPLRRCQQLAHELQVRRPDLTCSMDNRLMELYFGAWEGRDWSSIPRAEFDPWMADFAHGRPGVAGSERGESVAELMARVRSAWTQWLQDERDGAWVTHAGVMRAACLVSRGVCLPASAADWPQDELPYGQEIVLNS